MKEREKRTTAGLRMGALMGEEAEKDQQFWGHDTWNEEQESDYSDASDSSDEFDSDFLDSEDDDDEGDEEEVEKRLRKNDKKQSKQIYREPKAQARALTEEEKEELKARKMEARRKAAEEASLMVRERSKRESTVKKSQEIQKVLKKQHERHLKAVQAYAVKPRQTKCTFSQEEMLKESCTTEHDNARWLLARKRLLNEADTVANAPKRKKEYASRFYSKRGGHTIINFPDVDLMPAILQGYDEAPVPPEKPVCAITGAPAKYRDPKTGLPYATIEAFRQIRARAAKRGEAQPSSRRGGYA